MAEDQFTFSNNNFTEILLTVPSERVEEAADIAQMAAKEGIYIEDYRFLEKEVEEIAHIDLIDEELLKKDRNKAIIHLYIASDENPNETILFLKERCSYLNIDYEINCTICLEEDWANNWKKYFHPIKVGKRLLIRPIWEENFDAENRTVLHLEPGMSFGTGTHETTFLCLEFVDKYVKDNMSFLDIGCGSGILAVAALLLGAKTAVGVDIDDAAVRTAIQNANNNGVGSVFKGVCGNLTQKVTGKFDIIAANIVADVIINLLGDVTGFMHKNSLLLLSGIIDLRETDVITALKKDFEVVEISRKNGWVAICAACNK